ncbi:glycerate kinase [Stackebrandtia albiflava]|uniref:Glycerate kinase n=1 Tax=Stackebrandtia albiflava TaxID=406432 RepID=A0A562VBA8_9ACTN|nr:glycerate kinase [Stackebrandtia albiflava]TWJ15138.1 glycerate kinase [Stackebrandtia albiflava]
MRILICPDKFAGTLTAPDVAAAVADGWRSVSDDDHLDTLPLADGGPGMLDALEAALGGRRVDVPVTDPLGRAITAQSLYVGDTAYIESAQACGLHLLEPAERDPLRAGSFGLGMLIAYAVEAGMRRIVVGLGGSATNDAGAGMLVPLGYTALDERGVPLPPGGAALVHCARLEGGPRLRGVELVAATDVDNPLCGITGASAVFGPQKGADDDAVQVLDHALSRFGAVLERDVAGGTPVASTPGAGAAGGLGAALFALGARREAGTELVSRTVGLGEAMDECDLVVTGEGSFDHQSLRGKLVSGVAAQAQERGLPCVVVAGRVTVGRREMLAMGVTRGLSLVEHFGNTEDAMSRPAEGLRALGARLARQWRRS